ncbi:MAG: SAM-dependent methyltransferase [Candidatus Nanohaloarchaea archaeon]
MSANPLLKAAGEKQADPSEVEEVSREENILDATCGGRSIWLPDNKEREDTLYIDKREEDPGFHGQEGETYEVNPDERMDFRDLPFQDKEFDHIVFDPPHVTTPDGMERLTGQVNKKYGALRAQTWQRDIRQGFEELFRVLMPRGTLAFKFNDSCVDFKEVLNLAPQRPLYGTTTKKQNTETRWFIFYKEPEGEDQ